jgi:hypothetical protein
MKSYKVDFDRRLKGTVAWSFQVQADSPQSAIRLGERLMRQHGEAPTRHKPPKVREMTVAELLESA